MKTLKLSKAFLVFSLLILSFAFAEVADAKVTGTENNSNTASEVSFVLGGNHCFWPRRHHRRIRRRIIRRRWHRRHY